MRIVSGIMMISNKQYKYMYFVDESSTTLKYIGNEHIFMSLICL